MTGLIIGEFKKLLKIFAGLLFGGVECAKETDPAEETGHH